MSGDSNINHDAAGGTAPQPNGDRRNDGNNFPLALLTPEIFVENVLGFVYGKSDRKGVRLFMERMPDLVNHFQLKKLFCPRHGTKLETDPKPKLSDNEFDKAEVVAKIKKRKDENFDKGKDADGMNCVDCILEIIGRHRCEDCDVFFETRHCKRCSHCSKNRCERCHEVDGDGECYGGECRHCGKESCERDGCPANRYCAICLVDACEDCEPDEFICPGECQDRLCKECQENEKTSCTTCGITKCYDCFSDAGGSRCDQCGFATCGNETCGEIGNCPKCNFVRCKRCIQKGCEDCVRNV